MYKTERGKRQSKTYHALRDGGNFHNILNKARDLYMGQGKFAKPKSIRGVADELGFSYGTTWKLVHQSGAKVRPRVQARCNQRICTHPDKQPHGHCTDMMCSNYQEKCSIHSIAGPLASEAS